jgi:hypothetical protein
MKLTTTLLLSTTAFASTNLKYESCHSAKEYITTFNFLKQNDILTLKEKELQKVATKVSKGCQDSAKRFIKIFSVLTKSGLEGSNALNLAAEFSLKSNTHTNTFLTIFSESFLEKYLDLNIKDAVNISKKLALDLEGNIIKIKNDFQNTVKFCLKEDELNLTGPRCADIATKVVESGAKYNTEMANTFINSFKYASSRKGPNLATFKAVNLSLDLVKHGPFSLKNFKDGFEFSREKKNLDFSNIQAINFGKELAKRSSKEIKK